MEKIKIDGNFVKENIKEILKNIRPDLALEYLSERFNHGIGFLSTDGWKITVESNDGEVLGQYQNGELIAGKWHEEHKEQESAKELYKKLIEQAKTNGIEPLLYFNRLLCKGKKAGGICWAEHDRLVYIHEQEMKKYEKAKA